MKRVRIAGVALLVLLGAGLLSRITDHAGIRPTKADRAPGEIRAEEKLTGTETVDLKNGNLYLFRAARALRAVLNRPSLNVLNLC